MEIERETSSYNDRRYGKPWIAKVDFSANTKGDFLWGEWIGDPGDEGLLILSNVEPGDIVARGQKDLRKPKNSKPDWYKVTEDGSLAALDGRAAAFKAWCENNEK